jgi:predicted DNA-binding ribbon-helix-helix protein
MHVEIRNRLDRQGTRTSFAKRKYGPDLIDESLHVATCKGVATASRLTGIPYNTIKRWATARKRVSLTLQEAIADMENHPFMRNASKINRDRIIGGRQRSLNLNVEVARESHRIAGTTGIALRRCIMSVAAQRGVNGDQVYAMVTDGRIPEHWINAG